MMTVEMILLCGLLISTHATAVNQGDSTRVCPHNGVNFEGRCFWFSSGRQSWPDASIICSRLFGDHVTLATIKDEATNRFIRNQSNNTLWLGLHEAHGETNWRWLDHSSLTNGNYERWESPPEASNSKNCALMYQGADLWRDSDCKERHVFVCNELPSPPLCAQGGIYFRDRCYWITNKSLSFDDANDYCQSTYGEEVRLAVAKDAEVNLFLSRLIYPNIWIGLTDRLIENRWRWIDGSPVKYTNWGISQRNYYHRRYGYSGECCILKYSDARWTKFECSNRIRFICAVPPCYNVQQSATTGDNYDPVHYDYNNPFGVIEEDISICSPMECVHLCVSGGVCDEQSGECVCIKQFPDMVCDTADWQLEMESAHVKATYGSSFTLKCMLNLPVDHILNLVWIKPKDGKLSENRTTITNVLHKGYSLLQVTNVELADATEYMCIVTLSFGREGDEIVEIGGRSTVVDVRAEGQWEAVEHKPNGQWKDVENKTAHPNIELPYQPTVGTTAIIVTLSIILAVLVIAFIGMVTKGKWAKLSFPTTYGVSGVRDPVDCEHIIQES